MACIEKAVLVRRIDGLCGQDGRRGDDEGLGYASVNQKAASHNCMLARFLED